MCGFEASQPKYFVCGGHCTQAIFTAGQLGSFSKGCVKSLNDQRRNLENGCCGGRRSHHELVLINNEVFFNFLLGSVLDVQLFFRAKRFKSHLSNLFFNLKTDTVRINLLWYLVCKPCNTSQPLFPTSPPTLILLECLLQCCCNIINKHFFCMDHHQRIQSLIQVCKSPLGSCWRV